MRAAVRQDRARRLTCDLIECDEQAAAGESARISRASVASVPARVPDRPWFDGLAGLTRDPGAEPGGGDLDLAEALERGLGALPRRPLLTETILRAPRMPSTIPPPPAAAWSVIVS